MDVIPVEQGCVSGLWMCTKNKSYCENAKTSLVLSGWMRQRSGVGGCDPRIEVILKNAKKSGVRSGGVGAGCEPRIDVIVKMQKSRGRVAHKYACTVNHSLDDKYDCISL